MLSLPSVLASAFVLATVTAAPVMERAECPDYCMGIQHQDDQYVCGDPRLGPEQLPTRIPINVTTIGYDRFGGLCPGAFLATWFNDTGNASTSSFIYPPIGGFQPKTDGSPLQGDMVLKPGTLVDRFGSEYGTYFAPYGSPYEQRGLPPVNLNTPPGQQEFPNNYHVYEVMRNLTVLGGTIAPWFGQPGLGTQFQSNRSMMALVNEGSLRRMNLTELVDSNGEPL